MRLPAEQQHGGMGGAAGVEQVEMGQQLLGCGFLRQVEAPRLAGAAQEGRHPLLVQVGKHGITAGGRIEGAVADQFMVFQILHQGGIQAGDQFGGGDEAAADQLVARQPDQRLHLRLAAGIVRTLHEDQPVLVERRGVGELPRRRRQPLRILEPVLVTEQPDIEVAARHFLQIYRVRAAVGGGHVLEQKRLEETADQCIAAQPVAQSRPLCGELLLDTADEDAQGPNTSSILPVSNSCIMPCLRARVLSLRA